MNFDKRINNMMQTQLQFRTVLFRGLGVMAVLGFIAMLAGCGQDDAESAGAPDKPAPTEIVPVEPSEQMEYWLSCPATHWQILDDTAQEFADDMNSSLLYGDEGLRMEVAPGVKGTISGTWTQVKHRDFLDEVCEKNNWRWDVIEPNKILISPKD
jgi:hypothetical protein